MNARILVAVATSAGLLAPPAIAATAQQTLAPRADHVQVAQVVPAQYTWGTIKTIDRDRGMLTLDDGVTYLISPNDVPMFQPGQQVDIAYVANGQRREILSIKQLDAKPRERQIFPFSM